jgi:hypothetical protein
MPIHNLATTDKETVVRDIINNEDLKMSIKAFFDQQAIEMLPNVHELILKSNKFDHDQIIDYTLRAIMNTKIPLVDMCGYKVTQFENDLLATFKYKGWGAIPEK